MDFGKLVESLIKQAQDEGKFGAARRDGPLQVDDDSHVPEDARMAMRVLQMNGFAPDWIEQDKDLRARLTKARSDVKRVSDWRARQLGQPVSHAERPQIEAQWAAARKRFEDEIALINREIFHFNLRAPSESVQRLPLRVSEEYERLARG